MTNRIIIVLIVIVGFGSVSTAQSLVGLSGGYNFTFYHTKDETPHFEASLDSEPSWCFAAYVRGRRPGKKTHLGFETSYVKKQLHIQADYGGLGGSIHRDLHCRFDYLYFTFFPEWAYGKKIVFSWGTGLSFGFMLKSYEEGNSSSWSMGQSHSWEYKGSAGDDFSDYDMRFLLRFGLEIPLTDRLRIMIDNAYSTGLGSICSFGGFVNSRDISLNLGLAYRFTTLGMARFQKRFPNTQKIEGDKERLNKKNP